MVRIPVKLGKYEYDTIQKTALKDYKGEKIGSVSVTPGLLLDRALSNCEKNNKRLVDMDIYEIIDIFHRAAEIFKRDVFVGGRDMSLEEHIRYVVRTTGMPSGYIKESMAVIYFYLKNIEVILKAQSPNYSCDIYNRGFYERNAKKYGWVREGYQVGVVAPSNHPSVHTVWMTALAMKSQIVLRPASDDIISPLRIIQSLLDAGMPDDMLNFLPGEHELTGRILSHVQKGIMFGSQQIIDVYKKMYPYVKYYGPGSSKVFVDVEEYSDMKKNVNHVVNGVMSYGGKGCVSLSAAIFSRDGYVIADEVAKELAAFEIREPLDRGAVLSAVKDVGMAYGLVRYVKIMEDMGAVNLSAKYTSGEFVIQQDGAFYIRPIVLYMESDHPMFGIELPFPFVTITTVEKSKVAPLLRNSLALSLLSDDKELYESALKDSSIAKIHTGYTENVYDIDPEKSFEGYMSEYLFKFKSV